MVDYSPAPEAIGPIFCKYLNINNLQIILFYTITDWHNEPNLS